ncbi:MAG TPA: hypothetical protein VGF79_01660 [Bacteroidia bacterium]
MRTGFAVLCCFLLLNACQRDYYQDVPQSVRGLAILQIDTIKTPLKSSFFYDRVNHLVDEVNFCYERSMYVFRGYNLTVIVYHGLQLSGPNDTLFLNIKGALKVTMVDTNTLSIGSTLGEVMVDFLPNNGPVLKSFDYKKRVKEQYFNSCLSSKLYKEKSRYIENRSYHECPDTAQNMIYGWYIKEIVSPKCYY